MRTPRVYTSHPLSAGRRLVLESDSSHHLRHVLRLQPGAELELFNGTPSPYRGRINGFGGGGVLVDVVEALEPEPESDLEICLAQGIARGERMDYLLQKSVELGVSRITPLFTARSLVRLPAQRSPRRQQHWRGILIAACAQSGRCRLPELEAPQPFEDWISQPPSGNLIVLDPRAPAALPELSISGKRVTLLSGPEGGLDARESTLAARLGFIPVRLGPRILRAETAPLAALAAIQTLWGDFRPSA